MDTIYSQQVLGYHHTSTGHYTYWKNTYRSGKVTYGSNFYDHYTSNYSAFPDTDVEPIVTARALGEIIIVDEEV